jgi:hypothetical protein
MLKKEFSEKYKDMAEEMYRKICHNTINSLPNSKKDYTFTYREYCIMLKV